jgi:hypothetical protein
MRAPPRIHDRSHIRHPRGPANDPVPPGCAPGGAALPGRAMRAAHDGPRRCDLRRRGAGRRPRDHPRGTCEAGARVRARPGTGPAHGGSGGHARRGSRVRRRRLRRVRGVSDPRSRGRGPARGAPGPLPSPPRGRAGRRHGPRRTPASLCRAHRRSRASGRHPTGRAPPGRRDAARRTGRRPPGRDARRDRGSPRHRPRAGVPGHVPSPRRRSREPPRSPSQGARLAPSRRPRRRGEPPTRAGRYGRRRPAGGGPRYSRNP